MRTTRYFQVADPVPPPREKKFCRICGRKLAKTLVSVSYDEYTGARCEIYEMKCPVWRRHVEDVLDLGW